MPLPGPNTRVVELRVPGLNGTSGETLLDSDNTVEVAGDGLGKIIRPADRLRRPAPGPVIQALGRSMPRTLEGYRWDAMTSGGASKAIWALLFPFSLANVAHWMLPPARSGSRISAVLTAACRAVLRMTGLLLTMLFVTQLAVVSLDLFAAQCLAPGANCLPFIPEQVRELAALRTAIGILPLIIVVYVLFRVSTTDWSVKTDRAGAHMDLLPGDSLRASLDANVLRCLHTVAALACVALLTAGGPFQIPTAPVDLAVWAGSLGLLGVALVIVGCLPEKARARSLNRFARGTAILLALALVGVAAVRHTPLMPTLAGVGLTEQGTPSGTDGTVESIGAALLVMCVVFAALLVPTALTARAAWRHLPRRLRPWLGGWVAAPVLALAGLLGGGFGAGLAVALRQLTDATELRLPESYTLITILWGGGLVLALVLGIVGFAIGVPLRRRARGIPDVVRLLQDDPVDDKLAAAAWARSAWERRHLHQLVVAVVLGLCLGAAALLVTRYGLGGLPGWLDPFSVVGIGMLGLLAVGLLRIVYTAAKSPERSRHLGALADLVCFWPRVAHPTIPPCYALKVVPELASRAKEHLSEPNTRVVLTGYSLGSLLTVMATARLTRSLPADDLARVGLLTAGSPLQWGYQRAFPAVLQIEGLARLFGMVEGRWRGLARGTDVFGGGVTTWRHQVGSAKLLGTGYQNNGRIGPVPTAAQSATGALVLGGDHWLPDPMRRPTATRRWAAGVLKHRDYVVDPEWDRAIAMAAGLELTSTKPFGEQPSLFGELPRFMRG